MSPLRRAAYILCAATWLASGCATPPGLIAPADVSADKYATWPCDRIVERWNQLATALAEAEDVQADALRTCHSGFGHDSMTHSLLPL